jgi:hypothetical protein
LSNNNAPRNHRDRWTIQELSFLESHYGEEKTAKIAETLGRSVVSVRLAARKLGCRKLKVMMAWTKVEIAVLHTHYAGGAGIHRVSQLLPGRSPKSIQAHARKLGITSGRYKSRKWSEEEFSVLCQFYPTLGTQVVKKLPKRTKEAIKIMAKALEIRYQGGKKHGAHQRIWTEAEWQKLRDNNQLPPLQLLRYFPGRTRISIAKAKQRLKKWSRNRG